MELLLIRRMMSVEEGFAIWCESRLGRGYGQIGRDLRECRVSKSPLLLVRYAEWRGSKQVCAKESITTNIQPKL